MLRAVMDFALKDTKKTAQAFGLSMGHMVVLHRHLWLTLTETGSPVSGGLLGLTPQPQMVETSRVDGVREPVNRGPLFRRVMDTITEAQAPSTRRLYACKWAVFERWCESNGRDPENCPVSEILQFLQQRMDSGSMPSTLKVYVAAIPAFHATIGRRSVGKHDLVIRFLRGARRQRPSRPPTVPTWDLALVLGVLALLPYEPLQTVSLKPPLKTALLLVPLLRSSAWGIYKRSL